ncbi:hypothetical protein GCM10009414_24220 [Tatumella terrea]
MASALSLTGKDTYLLTDIISIILNGTFINLNIKLASVIKIGTAAIACGIVNPKLAKTSFIDKKPHFQ